MLLTNGTTQFPSPSPTVETLDISWSRGKFESADMAIDAVEKIAVDILMEETECSWGWASGTIKKCRDMAHAGDCTKARSWMQAPVTCMACVYDDAMLKAWQRLKEITGPVATAALSAEEGANPSRSPATQ